MAWISPSSKDQTATVVDLGTTNNAFVASNAVIASSDDDTILGTGSNHQVLVYGTVVGSGFGLFTIYLGDLPSVDHGESVHIMQGGEIETLASGVGIVTYGYSSEIINDGRISSPGGLGVMLRGSNSSVATHSTLINTGLIEGDYAVGRGGFDSISEAIVVKNSGTIRGEIAAFTMYGPENGPGDDLITNTGKIYGKIDFRRGDDLYDGRKGFIDSVVSGGEGGDRLYGGKENNILQGDAGNDSLMGRLGSDQLSGGAGKDVFIFTSVGDSTVKLAGRDMITDFSQIDDDIINLKAIDADSTEKGNQHFDLIGKHGFSGEAGELRFQQKAEDTLISADVNGDGKADFTIALDPMLVLHENDFIL